MTGVAILVVSGAPHLTITDFIDFDSDIDEYVAYV